jgi:prophage maintenance system killer protein
MKSSRNSNTGEVIIYTAPDGTIQTEVRMETETLWLSEQQIAVVFERDRTVIGRHIKNIIKTGELEAESNVQKMHIANSDKPVTFYNLDMILSVGYRVNSKRGTQFRIWANRVLKEYLVQGYSFNQKRLQEQQNHLVQLQDSIRLLERSILEQTENLDEARKIVCVLAEFAKGLKILDDYDHETLEHQGKTEKAATIIGPEEFLQVVQAMRQDMDSDVFAKPKDSSFDSSVRQIYQSFDGVELYPSIEAKAAMLLYFVVKNHSFIDGNKRIAAMLFLYFLDKNQLLFTANGQRKISDEGLAALTLLIAVSKPEEKDTMVNIVITILNRSLI